MLDEFSGFLDKVKTDGSSNLELFNSYWQDGSKQKLYDLVAQAAKKAIGSGGDPTSNPIELALQQIEKQIATIRKELD